MGAWNTKISGGDFAADVYGEFTGTYPARQVELQFDREAGKN
jgi:hypothetical protein